MRTWWQLAMLRWGRRATALALCAVLLAPAAARASEAGQAGRDFGVGIGTVAANILYIPAKLIYAGLGGITGLFAYGLTLGDQQVANEIWVPSLGGDYVVSSAVVQGREPIHFSGRRGPNL
jgi:hypothetical protein